MRAPSLPPLADVVESDKAVRSPLMKSPILTSDRFGFEPEIAARLAQARARVWEVSISDSGRTYEEGKKIGWRDGVVALWHSLPVQPAAASRSRPTGSRGRDRPGDVIG